MSSIRAGIAPPGKVFESAAICATTNMPSCRKPSLSVKELVLCFYQIAAGLGALHINGIIDQDIHPGSILCSLDGKSWKKADLGSATRNNVNAKANLTSAKHCQCVSLALSVVSCLPRTAFCTWCRLILIECILLILQPLPFQVLHHVSCTLSSHSIRTTCMTAHLITANAFMHESARP